MNEPVVEAMSATGKVMAQEVHVRDQPTTKGKNHPTTLKEGDQVHIMGQADTWYLVDLEAGSDNIADGYPRR